MWLKYVNIQNQKNMLIFVELVMQTILTMLISKPNDVLVDEIYDTTDKMLA